MGGEGSGLGGQGGCERRTEVFVKIPKRNVFFFFFFFFWGGGGGGGGQGGCESKIEVFWKFKKKIGGGGGSMGGVRVGGVRMDANEELKFL